MPRVHVTVEQLGGIARTSELLARGHEHEFIRMSVAYGRIVRVRRGWFASPEVPKVAIRARKAGGRLACLSALAYHGVLREEPEELHIEVPRSSSRLRPVGQDVVVHWTRHESRGDRVAVSAEEALVQARRCERRPGGASAGTRR